MAPPPSIPSAAATLSAKLQSKTLSVPNQPTRMAPPLASSPSVEVACPFWKVSPVTVSATRASVCKMRVAPPPSSVTSPAPSMLVSFDTATSLVTAMVTASSPQAKVTFPPSVTAERSASSVQLSGLPSPTTTLLARGSGSAGTSQLAGGGANSIGGWSSEPDSPDSSESPLHPASSSAHIANEQPATEIPSRAPSPTCLRPPRMCIPLTTRPA